MKKHHIILIAITVIIGAQANARELSIQQRLANVEKQLQQQSDGRTNTADVVVQNQQLQQQVAELKGVIEEQNYQIEKLKEKQKLLYIDIDSRLAELEAGTTTNTNVTQNVTDTAVATSDTNQGSASSAENTSQGDTDVNTIDADNSQQQPVLSTFQDDYDIAFAHLRGGRFLESARAFEDFIQKYPNNELTDNAYYWLGESYYVKRQYPQALAAFQALTQKFPNSSKAPDSWLKIGYSYYEMDDLIKADEGLNKVIDTYPNTDVAKLAKGRLRQLQRDN